MKRTSSQVEAEEFVEFKTQFGEFAKAALQVWKFPELDQGIIRDQLNRFYGWDESVSYAATWEFLRFFVLKAIHQDFDDEILAPSAIVERVWQCILMRPKFYYQMCHTLIGDLIDYNVDKTRSKDRYVNTLKLYEEQFNRKPDAKCWTSADSFEESQDEMDNASKKMGAEMLSEFKKQFGDLAQAAHQVWKFREFEEGMIRNQLTRFYEWDEDLSYAATLELLRFFVLKAKQEDFDDKTLAPSTIVERVWQCILLRPKFYYQVCDTLSGQLMDYNVDGTRDGDRYVNTLKLYEKQFKCKPDAKCWDSADSFGEEEEEEEVEVKETADDVEKAMYNMIQNNVRLTPFEVKQRWGHIVSEDKLRKMWVNLIARGSLGYTSVKKPRKSAPKSESKVARRSRAEIQRKNFIDKKFNDYGEGERYYIRCKNIGGTQLTVKAPKNALIGRVKKNICKILPNRTPQELVLTNLAEKEPLDDNKGLLEYGIFKDSTLILSFQNI